MKVKTYGVPGLTEWQGKVKAGSLEVAVAFTGGTASPSGAQPAYFMTKDPIVQFVIENSKEYKGGFIICVMSQEIPGDHPRMAVPKPKTEPKQAEAPAETEAAPAETEAAPEVAAEEQQPTSEPSQEGGSVEAGSNKIEVADRSEAIEYLKEHFADKNYTATGLRTKTAFDAACKECGVEFVFTE